MSKEFHMWFNHNYPKDTDLTYNDAMHSISEVKSIIHTTIPSFVSTQLLELGYRLYIHPANGDTFEIKLKDNAPRISREIKQGINLERLLLSGEFDIDGVPVCYTTDL